MASSPERCESPIGRFLDAYNNPRLEDPVADYLNEEHRDELRDQSELWNWEVTDVTDPILGVGTIQEITFETKQGFGYRAAIGIPEKQRTETLGLATSPLGTANLGYNRHMMLNYMRAGNYVGFVAAEGSHSTVEDRRALTRISLASTASTLLHFGHQASVELKKEGHDVHLRNRFVYGPSRAGAAALLANALDEDFAQSVKATDSIAPSPALKLDSFEQWQRVFEQVTREPAQTAYIIARLGLSRALKYRHSVSFKRGALAHHLEICGGLFNGELAAAARHIPSDKIIRVTEYEYDLTCNDGGLEQILAPDTHPNVAFEQLPGIHMSIVDRSKTLPIMMAFNEAFREFEASDIRSPQALFSRARALAPRQFPITEDQANKLLGDAA